MVTQAQALLFDLFKAFDIYIISIMKETNLSTFIFWYVKKSLDI